LPGISLLCGGALWVLSLGQVVFYTTHVPLFGYWVFVTGWMGLAVFQFAWFDNLLVLLAVLVMHTRPQRAVFYAVLAVLLAGQAFWFDAVPGEIVDSPIIGVGSGFWLWYASVILMALGVILGTGERK
ncbi:MAG: hypothetical protein ACK4RS_04650, partial [Thiothrix sp.]